MLLQFTKRMLFETNPRLLGKFIWNFGFKSLITMRRFKERQRRGESFPAVLFISVTTRCNLRCQGCWVSVDGPDRSLPASDLDRILRESKKRGNYFFGILGGEPLWYPDLWDVLSHHRDCYFQVLTNGTLITEDVAAEMRKLGNVTPLISIEGLESTSDIRRGGKGVYERTLMGLEHCRRKGLIIGVATSVCRSNIDELVSEEFIRELIDRGVHYLWYYIYRPVGPNPTPELVLTREQIEHLRSFMVYARTRAPILIIDAYWDDKGRALCPAAAGVSHHVNPWGDVEPCPPIQFAADNACNGEPLFDVINDSTFLRNFRQLALKVTPGCILLERPELLHEFLVAHKARDTSGRNAALKELQFARCHPSHHIPDNQIPEKHWFYRLSKKHWFFGLGTYG